MGTRALDQATVERRRLNPYGRATSRKCTFPMSRANKSLQDDPGVVQVNLSCLAGGDARRCSIRQHLQKPWPTAYAAAGTTGMPPEVALPGTSIPSSRYGATSTTKLRTTDATTHSRNSPPRYLKSSTNFRRLAVKFCPTRFRTISA